MYKILIMGPQGAGKGTQAELLAQTLGIPAISMGALLREEVASGSPAGQRAQAILESGKLVSDDLALGVILSRLARPDAAKGWILDGFPRVDSQADLFLKSIQPTHVILLELTDAQSLERLAGRLQCSVCQQSFHELYLPPKTPGLCDNCGGALIKRSDDNPMAINKRLEIYHHDTEPLLARYEQMGILHRVDGSGTVVEVAAAVRKLF